MKNKIIDLISLKPKHFSKMIKSDPQLYQWVIDNTLVDSENFSEMIYSAVYQVNNKCEQNNIKKFKSITIGYGFCGTAGTCDCASQTISQKVSNSKQNYTLDQKKSIQQKRIDTTIKKYGVINTAQTNYARSKHKEYYTALPKKPRPTKISFFQKLNKKYQTVADVEFVTPEDQYRGVSGQIYYQFRCLKCNSLFDDYIDNGHIPKCKICNPIIPQYTSKQENELYEYVKSITSKIVYQSNKTIISPYELDIVIPEANIAIEYCGLYWHSEAHKLDKNYHINKLNLCVQQGYRLITVFEDEWVNKSHIVKSRLKNILSEDTPLYARKCKVKSISITEAKQFVNLHHIQGWAVAKIAYGCFYHDQLVAVMTFGKPRYNKTIEYELIRYCSVGTVVGAAGRLFSVFLKEYTPKSVISYCDMRWGTGKLYESLNFIKDTSPIRPSYSYTDFQQRYHRSSFVKSQISNSTTNNQTEHQIMRNRNMYRIWDCGQSKWIYRSELTK